ncbi:MAG: MBL fold metallo-hydrolase [Myxococcota bacterium]
MSFALSLLSACSLFSSEPAVEEAPKAVEKTQPKSETTTFKVATEQGDLTITPVFHATLRVGFGDTVTVFDPWSKAELGDIQADYIFITDVHPDHMDPVAIRPLLKATTEIVAPPAVASDPKMADIAVKHVLANGTTATVGPFEVTAIPAYNLERGPKPGMVFHEKGRGNGYVLKVGGKSIYVAGDTECTDHMKQLANIDHAFLPVDRFTMTPGEAAECVLRFRPAAVTPTTYWKSDLAKFENTLLPLEGMTTVQLADVYSTGAPY